MHLSCDAIGILSGVSNAKQLIDCLSQSDSQTLKLATAEALEWLGYARRFVAGSAGDNNGEEHDE